MKSNNKADNEKDALELFNDIKDTYSQKIDELNDLKKEVSRTEAVDQQQKSKLRITIESLLIDLNEEIFSISEELAKSYTFERQKNILQKAKDFEQRKKVLIKKLRESIDDNQCVKIVRRSVRIQNASPPQKDDNGLGVVYGSQRKRVESPKNHSTKNAMQRNHTFNEVFSSDQSQKQSRQGSLGGQVSSKPVKQQRSSRKKSQKSPIPLRRKEDNNSQSLDKRSNSKGKKQQYSAKKQLFTYDEQPRSGRNKGNKTVKNSKKLDEFEKYLAIKSGKENYKPQEKDSQPLQQYSTMLQSEAFEIFAQDFAHMKNKILQMQQRLDESENKTIVLEEDVEKLKTENVKVTTDVKIIRSEHSEILHSLYSLEKKNSQLQAENLVLKRITQGEREVRGQETNMPKPYIEQINPADSSFQEIQIRQSRSPFSSILQKNRSLSHLRESKDEVLMGTQQQLQMGFNIQQPSQHEYKAKNDYLSFQPSVNVPQQDERNQYNNVRSSLKQWPHSNSLLSNSQERQVSQSFTHQQQNPSIHQTSSKLASGAQSRRDAFEGVNHHGRMTETPTNPGYNIMATEDTPSHYRRNDDGSRHRSFIQNKNQPGPSSASMIENTPNQANLSDWVLERINKVK